MERGKIKPKRAYPPREIGKPLSGMVRVRIKLGDLQKIASAVNVVKPGSD